MSQTQTQTAEILLPLTRTTSTAETASTNSTSKARSSHEGGGVETPADEGPHEGKGNDGKGKDGKGKHSIGKGKGKDGKGQQTGTSQGSKGRQNTASSRSFRIPLKGGFLIALC